MSDRTTFTISLPTAMVRAIEAAPFHEEAMSDRIERLLGFALRNAPSIVARGVVMPVLGRPGDPPPAHFEHRDPHATPTDVVHRIARAPDGTWKIPDHYKPGDLLELVMP